jgi:uncharacterized protein (UPF0147 family)
MSDEIRIFLSYAREDKEQVESLYQRLSDAGLTPWMDTKDILPGEKWPSAIERAIQGADFFIACLSTRSFDKRGFIQKEIRRALDAWQEKLGEDIYLIPARLENCPVPEALQEFQWVNLFEEDSWEKLLRAIREGVKRQGRSVPPLPKDGPVVPFQESSFQPDILLDPDQPLQARLAAIQQIDTTDPKNVETLCQVVQDQQAPETLRRFAILQLGDSKDETGRQALEHIWREPSNSTELLEIAAWVLATRGELAILGPMIHSMNKTRQTTARDILNTISTTEPAAIHLLMPKLDEGKVLEQLEALECLLERRDPGIARCLIDLMADSGRPARVRQAAALALSELHLVGLSRSMAVAGLVNVVEKASDLTVRQAALSSLIALREMDKVASLDLKDEALVATQARVLGKSPKAN